MEEKNRADLTLHDIGKEAREISRDMTTIIMDIQRIQERGEALFGGAGS